MESCGCSSLGNDDFFKMRLFLIRHGETDWNAERRVQGHTDIELNETGRQQAEALALALKEEPLAAVYSSSLKRAHSTATIIAAQQGLAVQVHSGLIELDQGELDGLRAEELRRDYDGVLRRWNAGETSARLPGGESMQELQERAWAAVQEIHARHAKETVAVVGHNLANLAIICKVLHLPLAAFRRFRQNPGSLSLLELGQERSTLLRFNDVCHYQLSNRE